MDSGVALWLEHLQEATSFLVIWIFPVTIISSHNSQLISFLIFSIEWPSARVKQQKLPYKRVSTVSY